MKKENRGRYNFVRVGKIKNSILEFSTISSAEFKKKILLGFYLPTLDVVFRQIEIVLKDSTAFVYVTKSEKSSH